MPALFVPDMPTCGPRVKDGGEYYIRNRDGSMKNYLDQSNNKNFVSPRPMPRTGGSSEAMEQMEKSRGSMNNFMDQKRNTNYMSARPPPRCPSAEALEQYTRARGSMTNILSGHGGRDPRNKGPLQSRSVKPEAEKIATASKGLATKKLFATYGKVTARPPPQCRVKPEAEEISKNSKGTATKNLFHNYGQQGGMCPKQAKGVSDEARDAATQGQGGRAKSLLMME